jgi:hypothetical protein
VRHTDRRGTCAVLASLAIAGGGAFALLASPASASPISAPTETTDTTAAPAAPVEAAKASTTLPLFGAQLTVDVSTTPSGGLARVSVNPANNLTATQVHPNRVTFVNDVNNGKVHVETHHGAERTGVVAGSLAEITGEGAWSGDLFNTGITTTVKFKIVDAGDGSPDITAISTTDPSATIGDVQHTGGDHRAFARATITFTSGIQSRRLTITAAVIQTGDKARAASQVSLSKISGTSLPADQAAGDHTWTGKLCDGTTASVAYSVANDGTITAGAVTPASAQAAVDGNTLKVTFSDTESVRIRVSNMDGNHRISAEPRLRCGRTTPSVNTPTTPDATSVPWHHDGTGDGRNGPGSRGGDPGDRNDGWGHGSH